MLTNNNYYIELFDLDSNTWKHLIVGKHKILIWAILVAI